MPEGRQPEPIAPGGSPVAAEVSHPYAKFIPCPSGGHGITGLVSLAVLVVEVDLLLGDAALLGEGEDHHD